MKLGKIYKDFFKDWREMKRKAIIQYLKEKGMARGVEISKALGVSLSTVMREISKLIHEGKVEIVEKDSYVYYRLRKC